MRVKDFISKCIAKLALVSVVLSMFLGSLAPMATHAATFSAISDVMTRVKQGDTTAGYNASSVNSGHIISFTLPTTGTGSTFAAGDVLVVDFSDSNATALNNNDQFGASATSTWAMGDFTFTDGSNGFTGGDETINSGAILETATNTTRPAKTDLVFGTCTTAGALCVSMVKKPNGAAPLFGFKLATGSTATAAGATISITFTTEAATNGELENPRTTGSHTITLGHLVGGTLGSAYDNSATFAIGIVAEDQATVSGTVDPTITFAIGTSTSTSGTCTATYTPTAFSGTSVDLSTLKGTTAGPLAVSGNGTTPFICSQVSTNAGSGAIVTVKSLNGALKDSVKNITMPTSAQTLGTGTALAANTEFYGLCVTRIGRTATTPENAVLTVSAANGFDSAKAGGYTQTTGQASTEQTNTGTGSTNCPTTGSNYGGAGKLSADTLIVWSTNNSINQAYAEIAVRTVINTANTPPGTYSDTLTFVAYGTF